MTGWASGARSCQSRSKSGDSVGEGISGYMFVSRLGVIFRVSYKGWGVFCFVFCFFGLSDLEETLPAGSFDEYHVMLYRKVNGVYRSGNSHGWPNVCSIWFFKQVKLELHMIVTAKLHHLLISFAVHEI